MGPHVEHTAWTQWVPRLLVCYIFKGRSRISNTIFSSVKTWHLKYVHNFKSGGPSPLTKHQKALCLGISWFMCLYFALWSEFHIYSFFLHAVVMVMMAQFFTWPWISFITTLFLYRSHSGAHRSLAYWFSASNHHFIELIKWYSNSSIKKNHQINISLNHQIMQSPHYQSQNRQSISIYAIILLLGHFWQSFDECLKSILYLGLCI